jgi:hypothetical protein
MRDYLRANCDSVVFIAVLFATNAACAIVVYASYVAIAPASLGWRLLAGAFTAVEAGLVGSVCVHLVLWRHERAVTRAKPAGAAGGTRPDQLVTGPAVPEEPAAPAPPAEAGR